MAQPPAYNRQVDFTDRTSDQTDHPALNAELDDAAQAINLLRDNLAAIQRDDKSLRLPRAALRPDELSALAGQALAAASAAEDDLAAAQVAAQAAVTAAQTAQARVAAAFAGGQDRGGWSPQTLYQAGQIVWVGNVGYQAKSDHTSSATFAADLAAGKWVVFQGLTRGELAAAEGAGIVGFQQRGAGAVPRTMLSKARENVSVRDFMSSEAMIADSFLAAPVLDHSDAVQNFFNYLATSAVGFADCSGNFRITRPIVINGLKTLTVNCGVKFICDFATEDAAILITNSWYSHFTGQIEVVCKGGTGFASRTIGTGIRVTDDSRINLDYVVVRYAKYFGMVVNGVSSQASIDYLSCNYCGTAFGSAAVEYKRNVVAASKKDAAQNGSRNQRSLLTLDGGMDVIDKTRFIYVLGEVYTVTAVDKATSTIEVFPWLDAAVVAGSVVDFVVGGGYYSVSGDTSVINIGTLDALVCGVGYHCESLYPGLIGTFVSQNCGIGVVIGSGPSNAAVGGSMSVAYFEANKLDILIPTSAQLSYKIQSTTAWTPERNVRLSPRFNDNSINLGQRQFTGIEIGFNGKTISAPNNSTINYSGVIVTPEPSPSSFSFSKLDTQSIYLTPSRAFDIYQHQDVYVMTVGNAAHGGPSGTVTFIPSSGYTINGAAAGINAVYTGLTGPTLWHAYLDGTGKNWRVSKCTFSK